MRNRQVPFTGAMFALASIYWLCPAGAQVYFPNDATIDYEISDQQVIIGKDEQGNNSSPYVQLVSGGAITQVISPPGPVEIYNRSRFDIASRIDVIANAHDSSLVNVSDGYMEAIVGYDTSHINFNGGRTFFLIGNGNSALNVRGGSVVGQFQMFGSSTLNMMGGSAGSLDGFGNSTLDIRGGHIQEYWAHEQSTLNFYGTNLNSVLIDPNSDNYSRYSLSGTLLDGTVLNNHDLFVYNGTGAQAHLYNVPAPGALLTSLIGAAPGVWALVRRRRKCGAITA